MSTINETRLAASAHQVLRDAIDPRLPGLYRGKVRDNYDLPGGRRLLVATDAFALADAAVSQALYAALAPHIEQVGRFACACGWM